MSANIPFTRSKSPFLTNKRSLPKEVQAYLAFDLTWCAPQRLNWRPIYNDYLRSKIENRWQTIKATKNKGGEDWRNLLQASKALIKELGKSRKRNLVPCLFPLNLTFQSLIIIDRGETGRSGL